RANRRLHWRRRGFACGSRARRTTHSPTALAFTTHRRVHADERLTGPCSAEDFRLARGCAAGRCAAHGHYVLMRPNQSVELTATRRTLTLSMIRVSSLRAPLAVGGGSSLPSR